MNEGKNARTEQAGRRTDSFSSLSSSSSSIEELARLSRNIRAALSPKESAKPKGEKVPKEATEANEPNEQSGTGTEAAPSKEAEKGRGRPSAALPPTADSSVGDGSATRNAADSADDFAEAGQALAHARARRPAHVPRRREPLTDADTAPEEEGSPAKNVLRRLRQAAARTFSPEGTLARCLRRAAEQARAPGSAARLLLGELFWAGAAFLAVRAVPAFGARPFGFALLCAAPDHVPALLCGCLAAAFTVGAGGELIAAAALCAVGLRILVRCLVEPPADGRLFAGMFGESVYLRMATAAVAAFAAGFGMLVSGDFYLYDLWGTVISTVAAPAAVLLYLPLFRRNAALLPAGEPGRDERDDRHGTAGRIAKLALAATLALSLRGVTVLGIAPFHLLVTAVVLFTLDRGGLLWGVIAGAVCGGIAGWREALLYASAAVAAHFFLLLSPWAGGLAATACGTVLCALTRTPAAFWSVLPAQLLGTGLFCLARRGAAALPREDELPARAEIPEAAGETDERSRARFAQLSAAFGQIADVYEEFSRSQSRPGMPELREICDGVCDIYCPGCPKREVCWEAEYSVTLEAICRMCISLYEGGRVDPSLLPQAFAGRCDCLGEIVDAVDFGAASLVRRRLCDCRLDVLSHDSRAVAQILSEALARDRHDRTPDRAREGAVREALDSLGVRYSALSVTGTRRLRITASDADLTGVRAGAEEVRRRLEFATGHLLTPLTMIPRDDRRGGTSRGERLTLSLCTREKYTVTFAAARSAAGGREAGVCGDVAAFVEPREDGDGYFYAVLCDGMGTGPAAASAAKLCCDLLRRMLAAEMSVEAAIEMLNSVLRSTVGERSVGLDLLRIDLLDGSAAIWKSGAAASCLRRGRRVRRIEARSVPVGILGDAEAARQDFTLAAGDAILLTSDGICQSAEPDDKTDEDRTALENGAVGEAESAAGAARSADGGNWLETLLGELDTGSGRTREEVQLSADEAVRRAVRHARIVGSRDDLSAVLVILRRSIG